MNGLVTNHEGGFERPVMGDMAAGGGAAKPLPPKLGTAQAPLVRAHSEISIPPTASSAASTPGVAYAWHSGHEDTSQSPNERLHPQAKRFKSEDYPIMSPGTGEKGNMKRIMSTSSLGMMDGAGGSAMARNMSTTSLSSMLSNTSEFTVYEESKHGPLPAFQDADGNRSRDNSPPYSSASLPMRRVQSLSDLYSQQTLQSLQKTAQHAAAIDAQQKLSSVAPPASVAPSSGFAASSSETGALPSLLKTEEAPQPAASIPKSASMVSLGLLVKAADKAYRQLEGEQKQRQQSHKSMLHQSKSLNCLSMLANQPDMRIGTGRSLVSMATSLAALPLNPGNGKVKPVRQRPVRPKVVESKGTLQCLGMNRKKKTRCRNAALMEYIGPRPLYCAEHIALDPKAQYHKCNYRLPDESKGCKEIVYKDFLRCYKHFDIWLNDDFTAADGAAKTKRLQQNVRKLLTQLESEACVAKREDPELYQRKSKLIPKYQSMENSLKQHLTNLG